MLPWKLLGGFAAGASYLAGRALSRRSPQGAAAQAAGLEPVRDLLHDVGGADAFADLTTTALAVVDGVLAASRPLSPRGVVS